MIILMLRLNLILMFSLPGLDCNFREKWRLNLSSLITVAGRWSIQIIFLSSRRHYLAALFPKSAHKEEMLGLAKLELKLRMVFL